MEYRERIEAKVGILFQIADQYLSGQIPLEKGKELIGLEMVLIRPAQFEAMKEKLEERLKEAGGRPESERLFELFRNYISPSYNKLQNGHPLRNYYEENSRVRSYLLRMDEMEGEEAALEDWRELYELLGGFRVHIKRQEKFFYPRLTSGGMGLQAENAKELGNRIHDEIGNNRERLNNGSIGDFFFHQRNLVQSFMRYLDLEERVLYPNALITFTARDFAELRGLDDQEGYAYIDPPAEFIPKEDESSIRKERGGEVPEKKKENREIDSTQNIAELFRKYPGFRKDFYGLDEELKGLKGPLGMELFKESTVGMLAKSLRIDASVLVDRINKLLKSY